MLNVVIIAKLFILLITVNGSLASEVCVVDLAVILSFYVRRWLINYLHVWQVLSNNYAYYVPIYFKWTTYLLRFPLFIFWARKYTFLLIQRLNSYQPNS